MLLNIVEFLHLKQEKKQVSLVLCQKKLFRFSGVDK